MFFPPGIPMTKKKFAELKLSLLHLQQNMEIPETCLVIHPVIQWAVKQVCVPSHFIMGRSTHLQNRPLQRGLAQIYHTYHRNLNNSSFLNTLHAHMNLWIKSVQAMMKLNRDVASGTVSQEINFWVSMERALEGIETQLRSKEVNIVMGCLRNAKGFLATISFIADTGLKDATDNGKPE
jgi:dynein heavy chain 1